MEKRGRKIMNTKIGQEIKKKKNLSQRRAIHNCMHKRYVFEIYMEQINKRIRGSYDLMVK